MSGNVTRLNAIAAINAYKPMTQQLNFAETPTRELFNANVFSTAVMKDRLPKQVYKSLMRTINQGESLATVRDFGARQAIGYPLLVDDDNDVNLRYTINSLPTTIFVDADGVVREVIVGVVSQAVLEDRISSLLAEKP